MIANGALTQVQLRGCLTLYICTSMFITFEGIDGSGKSTQIKHLKERLEAMDLDVEVYREPGGTQVSEHIRHLLLDPVHDIHPFAELLLFSAARAQLVSKKVVPALERGAVVICDRFYDSTTAYQGAGRGLGDMDWMVQFHERVTGGVEPDRTYYLSIPIDVALARREARSGADRMEQTGGAFFQDVVDAYEKLAQRYPKRIVTLDGTSTEMFLHEQIWDDISNTWQLKSGTRLLG